MKRTITRAISHRAATVARVAVTRTSTISACTRRRTLGRAGWLPEEKGSAMYALPWPADALLTTMTASAWCRWLESRDPL